MSEQSERPPTRRAPLGEATHRVNNQQLSYPQTMSKPALIPHHESLRKDGLLQVQDGLIHAHYGSPMSPLVEGDYYPPISAVNPRLSAISKEQPVINSNRSSQISTVSTNASDGKRIKAMIGPWKLGKTLGKGATARVRLARHAYTGQEAAVKIVQKKNAQMSQAGSLVDFERADSQTLEMDDGLRRMPVGIEREVAIMKLIQHPHIMKMYDIWENRTEM
jgi:serine/threonine-protein kinase HSL1 (negative regulator of Swe1 kinase)